MKMKTNILSLLALTGALFLTVACASEDTANQKEGQEPNTEGLTSFVEEDNATRTTGEYDGSGLNFYWTLNDRLWVNTGTALAPVLTQDSKNNINATLENHPTNPSAVKRVATAKFYFAGTFTATSYPVRYTGKNGAKDKVTIKASQSQTVANDASHIAEDGDFAVATATKPTGGGAYFFTLDHKASYLTFMPYSSQGVISGAKLQKIRVYTSNTSDALAGTFDLADDGTLSNATSTSNSVELALNNFSIPSTFSYTTNGATMVVTPGTYSNVSIEYTLHDPVTHATGTITKTYPSLTFTAGNNKKVKTNLQVTVYPHNNYYMWDAQHQYWYGHESSQSTPENPSSPYDNSWPQNRITDSDRWYNDVPGYSDPTGAAPAVLPNTSHFQALPNANEAYWYAQDGDPHWDTELWAIMGHLYAGGMWFKKKSKISGYNPTTAPNGINYTKSTSILSYTNNSITQGKPSNPNDYFYLPALGGYYLGALYSVGNSGSYFSSTPYPIFVDGVYCLSFSNNSVWAGQCVRRYQGMQLWTAQ